MKNIISTLPLIVIFSFMAACSPKERKTTNELPPIRVSINETDGSDQGAYVTASGKIEAENSAVVSTRVMGHITSIMVKIGQEVSKGQLMATVGNADLQAKKAQAEAGVAQAMAIYNNAKKDYDRFVALLGQKSVSQKEMDDITTHFEVARSGLETAKQMKNEIMAQFPYTHIRAPFSGTVTGTFLKEGDLANPGMPIVSVEGGATLQAVVGVSESEITKIKNGTMTEVHLKSLDRTVKGKVVEISTSARNTGGQYIVKIDLEDGGDVLPGMFVNAVFPIERSKTETMDNLVLIPLEAIVDQGQLKGIYVVSDHTAILRWLRLGKTYGDQIEVLSGLSPGEKYVVKAEGRLFNGAKVGL